MTMLSTERQRDLAALLFVAILTFTLHGSVLGSWWTYDDPQLLIQASHESFASIFFSPSRWRLYSASNFVPLLPASYKADLLMAGLEPSMFYLHHLLALAACAVLFVVWLRRFCSRTIAVLSGVAFAVSPLVFDASHMLMLRHYLEGLVFAFVALLTFDLESRRVRNQIIASIAYLIAMLGKEIFAPLPLIMIAISVAKGANWKEIARNISGPAIAAAVYLPWRLVMLGSAGGYGDFSVATTSKQLLPSLWFGIAGAAPAWVQILWGGSLAAIVALVRLDVLKRRFWLAASLVVIFALLPVVPVIASFERRHAFGVGVVVVAACALLAEMSRARRTATAGLALIVVVAAIAGLQQKQALEMRDRIMHSEGHFIWDRPSDEPRVLLGTSGGWYLEGLQHLRRSLRNEPAPAYMLSPVGLVLEQIPHARVVSAIGWPTPEVLESMKMRRRPYAIRVRAGRKGNSFFWNVSAPGEGTWFLLSPLGLEMIDLPVGKGARPFPSTFFAPSTFFRDDVTFRFVWFAKDQTWAATPPLPFPKDGQLIEWPPPGVR